MFTLYLFSESLLGYFAQFGEIVDCVVMKNPETGKSRGFGFVTYKDPSCVETILSVTAHIVDGRQVSCCVSRIEDMSNLYWNNIDLTFVICKSLYLCIAKFKRSRSDYIT